MWWKLYTWFLAVIAIIGYSSLFLGSATLALVDFIDVPLAIVSFIGLFAFSYSKKLFTIRFWRYWVWGKILWDLTYTWIFTVYLGISGYVTAGQEISLWEIAIGYLLTIPAYIALYLYGYRRELIWDAADSDQNNIPEQPAQSSVEESSKFSDSKSIKTPLYASAFCGIAAVCLLSYKILLGTPTNEDDITKPTIIRTMPSKNNPIANNKPSKAVTIAEMEATVNEAIVKDKSITGKSNTQVFNEKIKKYSNDELNNLPDGRKKLETAAGHFLGYYLSNTRLRPEYCANFGVAIPTFVSEFNKVNHRELTATRKVLASASESDIEKLYAQMKPMALKGLKYSMDEQAAQANLTTKQFCQAIEMKAAQVVEALRYSVDMPLQSKVLLAAKL